MTTRLQGEAGGALLERERELALLVAQIERVGSGDGRLVVVEAGAGMGKTQLLAAARRSAEAAGIDVMTARGGELEQEFSFGVVRQLFEPLVAAASAEESSVLFSGAAHLALPLFEKSEAAGVAATDASFATMHGLYWLTANIAQRRPLMLIVDDLHWADQPSLRWLAYLTRRLEGLPLLLAVASRPPEQGREPALVAEVLTDPAVVVVRPLPLGRKAVAGLVRDVLGLEPGPELVDACRTATGGNPLFLRALLDTLARGDAAPVAANVLESGPEAVSRFVTIRLARLGREATSLIRAAAVLGEGVPLRHCAVLAGLAFDQAARSATALVNWELLRREDPIDFSHPIVRNVVYRGIPADERSRAHRQAAELLRGAPSSLERAAAHLLQTLPAGDPAVSTMLCEAAERALAQGAPESARAYLERALAESAPDEERSQLLRLLGVACLNVDAFEAAAWLGQAFEATADPVERATTATIYFTALEHGDRFAAAADVMERAIAGLEGRAPELRRLLEALLIECTFWDPELRESGMERIATLNEAQFGEGLGADALRASLAFNDVAAGAGRGRAIALADAAMASGELVRQGFTAGNAAILALMASDELDRAKRLLDEAIADKRRRGDLVLMIPLLLLRSLAARWRGDLLGAEEDLRAPEIELVAGGSVTSAYRVGFLADVLVERGEIEEAQHLLVAAPASEQVHAGWRLFYLQGRGAVRLAAGRPAEALADYRTLGEFTSLTAVANPALAPWRSGAALCLHALSRDEEARELAADEVHLARQWGAARPLGAALRVLGLLTGGGAGEELLREAVAVLAGSPARVEYARALVELGAALRRRNARTEGREHLREGLELAHTCSASALAERARDELVAAGARPRRISSRGADSLTPSERRVARMAAEGLTNKEIAQALFVTVKAVEVHLSNTYRKLGIGSRTQLASALEASAAAR